MNAFPYRRIALATTLLALLFSATWVLTRPVAAHAASNFVTRSGTQLQLNGSPFRIVGTNLYWLGLDESIGTGACVANGAPDPCAYPSSYRVDDALQTAQEMGATVVRAHTLGISVGCPLCVEPSLGTFNDTALQYIDYAIKSAHDHNLRLIIPLVDNYRYYHGGKHTFTDWRGISDENQFFVDATVISDFETYVDHILNHVSVYTGIALKDDPTILGWETGNEIYSTTSWTQTIATHLRSVDANHLIVDGYRGISTDDLALNDANGHPLIDMTDDHFYPMSVNTLNKDVGYSSAANRPFLAGEYDWPSSVAGGDSLASFLGAIESNSAIAGDLFWDGGAHADANGFDQHNGSLELHYPGSSSTAISEMQALRTHAYTMRGTSAPAVGTPGAPLITSITGNQIAWRGATLGASYSVDRSTASSSGPWTTVCNQCASDYTTPWTDSTQPSGTVWYRVVGFNLSGGAGAYSPTVQAGSGTSAGNLAAGKAVAVSSTVSWTSSFGGSNLTDNNVTNFWTSQELSSSAANEWAAIDLGSQQSFSRVVLYPRVSNGVTVAFPSAFTLQGTNDPNAGWTNLLTESNYPRPAPNAGAAFSVGAQSYRYVRVLATTATLDDASNYYVQLAEIEIYNNALSTNKPVAISSTVSWTSGLGGSNLTDNNLTDFWTSQELSSSAANEWAAIDLGSQQSFSRVVLYPRASNGVTVAFPSAFTLQGTNDPNAGWTNLQTISSFFNPPAASGQAFVLGSQSYRYVRVLATTATHDDASNYYVQLAEIEVD